jgi:hypothetical protein
VGTSRAQPVWSPGDRPDGMVEASMERYLERHGFGVVARTFYRIFYRIGGNRRPPRHTREHAGFAKSQVSGTGRHGRERADTPAV